MWLSVIYAAPETATPPAHWRPNEAYTLFNILQYAQQNSFRGALDAPPVWATSQLIAACKAEGLQSRGQEERWVAGKRSIGARGFQPVYVRAHPPKLNMLEKIRGKSLDELDELMVLLSQEEQVADNAWSRASSSSDRSTEVSIQDSNEGGELGRILQPASLAGRSIMADFAEEGRSERAASRDGFDETTSTAITVSSGSIFTPFARRR